jgi:hypothetical protein
MAQENSHEQFYHQNDTSSSQNTTPRDTSSTSDNEETPLQHAQEMSMGQGGAA